VSLFIALQVMRGRRNAAQEDHMATPLASAARPRGCAAAEVVGHRQVAVAKEKVVIVLTLELAAAVLHKPFLVFAKEMHILVSGDKFVLHREILCQAYPNIGV